MVKVLDTDSELDIASKIYERFEVLESCSVIGWSRKPEYWLGKGEEVLAELRRMDADEHIKYMKNGKRARLNVYKPESIGGPMAHKIFVWERTIVNNEPRYRIWRVQ
jgi:hypothetical protein